MELTVGPHRISCVLLYSTRTSSNQISLTIEFVFLSNCYENQSAFPSPLINFLFPEKPQINQLPHFSKSICSLNKFCVGKTGSLPENIIFKNTLKTRPLGVIR